MQFPDWLVKNNSRWTDMPLKSINPIQSLINNSSFKQLYLIQIICNNMASCISIWYLYFTHNDMVLGIFEFLFHPFVFLSFFIFSPSLIFYFTILLWLMVKSHWTHWFLFSFCPSFFFFLCFLTSTFIIILYFVFHLQSFIISLLLLVPISFIPISLSLLDKHF